jgi:glycosyltransferase involved in cell wall biosynthesis
MLEARALVFPSLVPESFGLALVEALACGLPVLTNSNLPILSLLTEDSGVIRLEPTLDSWREGLAQLEDDQAVNALGGQARLAYLSRFSPTTGFPLLERFLSGEADS